MPRNPGLLPDEEGYEPYEDDDTRIEIIELIPGAVLCAFVIEGARDEDIAKITRYWQDTVCPDAAGRMAKFLNNLDRRI